MAADLPGIQVMMFLALLELILKRSVLFPLSINFLGLFGVISNIPILDCVEYQYQLMLRNQFFILFWEF